MAPPPRPYSGKSTLPLVARVPAFSFGLVYGSVKLKILKKGERTARFGDMMIEDRNCFFFGVPPLQAEAL